MLSTLCTKAPVTTAINEVDLSSYSLTSSVSSTLSTVSVADYSPLVLQNPTKSHHCVVENSNLLSHLRRLILGTSTFQFQRFQDAEADEDAGTVVTYISLGASTPLQQRQMNLGQKDGEVEKNETLAKCLVTHTRRQKSPKKRHVSWKDLETGATEKMGVSDRHSMCLPSLHEIKLENQERPNRRHSYTEANDFPNSLPYVPQSPPPPPPLHQNLQKQHQRTPTAASMGPNESVDFNERKARYKLQLRHFKHRRRYSDWYFTLYEFDKPDNPEEPLALDSHLFDTILSRLHGIYALSLNSAFDPKNSNNQNPPARLCFERLPELPTAFNTNNSSRRHHRKQRQWDSRFIDSSSSSCLSCISFGMFDSSSSHNPGQLFCPEHDLFGRIGSFYCRDCGRNMTGGSSLASVAGSSGSEQRPEFCYSMTRSVEFYRFTRTIQLQRRNERTTESKCCDRTSPSQPNPTSKAPNGKTCRVPKRSRHRSSGRHHLRESVSMPPSQPSPHSFSKCGIHSAVPQTRNSIRERRKKVRRVMHQRMSQQRVADWLIATHDNQATAFTPPLIVF